MDNCPHCGERVDPGDAYCFECGTELAGSPRGTDTAADRSHERQTGGRTREHRGGGRGHERRDRQERGQTQTDPEAESDSGKVESLRTLWVTLGLSILAVLETGETILRADANAEQAREASRDAGFGEETVDMITADILAAVGVLGLLVAVAVVVFCYRYYQRGYVSRRFFWGVIVAGVLALFLGVSTAVLLIAAGAYGLLVVVRRDDSGGQPASGVQR